MECADAGVCGGASPGCLGDLNPVFPEPVFTVALLAGHYPKLAAMVMCALLGPSCLQSNPNSGLFRCQDLLVLGFTLLQAVGCWASSVATVTSYAHELSPEWTSSPTACGLCV